MVWNGLLLLAAIACEILATGLLKRSDGMSRPWPTVGMLAGFVVAGILPRQGFREIDRHNGIFSFAFLTGN